MGVPIALGVIFLISGLFSLIRKILFMRRAIPIKCLITQLETIYESLPAGTTGIIGVRKDVPVVWFKISNDTNIVARLPSTHFGKYNIEQDIIVFYDPRKPQKIAIPSLNYWYTPIVLFVFGTLCFLGLLVFH